MFDSNSNKAIYLQIADAIADEILDGKLRAGDRLPSVREFAASHEVNVNTVMRSYEYLSGQELIVNKRGIGYFVSNDAIDKISAIRNRQFVEQKAPEFFRQLQLLGITPDALKDQYELFLNNSSN